ncbi:sigma-70 family RNA polymerase sigma factor [Fibrella sp. HMF5335]|uniref:Sigma-70 family RNA polymerase sigma factor n=1 Tax=Fibrella rubiginis TaxID=2817060 RepID=A0A939GCM3_9BACT|nr:sigma-70 family RNA polymerase sigma factor [Fibrella rubiginis]MBO0936484.1 sigma-70 family RNA polymerase sigma factor [Fibrella rubiginis]
MRMTTHDIAQQLSQPTSKLLEWLYEQYAQRWYGTATTRWGLDADSAWDVIYKTLDTLLAKRTSLPTDPPAHFENYLFKVFINNLRQCLREQARRHETMRLVPMNRDSMAEPYTDADDPAELALSDQTYEQLLAAEETHTQPMLARLEAALAQLDETDQSLLLLKAQQFSYDEIAQMLSLENNQLKVRHFRAKQRLINLFNQTQP